MRATFLFALVATASATPLHTAAAENNATQIAALVANGWVDRQTRAVFISLNLYNGNYNYYCQTQFVIEFSTGGTVT